MKTILRAAMAAILIGGLSLPAQADEIEEALQMALEAYQAGDINAAKEEIDYAAQLTRKRDLSAWLPAGHVRLGQNRKSVTARRMSAFGGTAEVDFGRLNVCL